MEYKALLKRTIDLAALGDGYVSPNPMVGAVLVSVGGTIIGEGWHKSYGKAHAEVNCVADATKKTSSLPSSPTLIVSLTPCSVHGNTPPCTDLIIQHNIPKVIIGTEDFSPKVLSDSLNILKSNKIEYSVESSENAKMLARFRNVPVDKQRPYLIHKFARSVDGFYGKETAQVGISDTFAKRLTHKWRSRVDAILVGPQTALLDNPQLNNRHYYGKSPIRILFDRTGRTAGKDLHLFDGSQKTIVFTNNAKADFGDKVEKIVISQSVNFITNSLNKLYKKNIYILLIEGGSRLQTAFIEANLWDEIRVIESHKIYLKSGVKPPVIPENIHIYTQKRLHNDTLHFYFHEHLNVYL